jgi:hypothetical protein
LNRIELRAFINNLIVENAQLRPKNPIEAAEIVKKVKGKTFAIDMYSILLNNESDVNVKSGYQSILDYINQD